VAGDVYKHKVMLRLILLFLYSVCKVEFCMC